MPESAFWSDLAADLQDEEFRRKFVLESVRIETIDRVINMLDDARDAAGLSKASLARAVSVHPAVMRRLFTSGEANPTLRTLADVATALGMKITLEPLAAAEKARLSEAVLSHDHLVPDDAVALAVLLLQMREDADDRVKTPV